MSVTFNFYSDADDIKIVMEGLSTNRTYTLTVRINSGSGWSAPKSDNFNTGTYTGTTISVTDWGFTLASNTTYIVNAVLSYNSEDIAIDFGEVTTGDGGGSQEPSHFRVIRLYSSTIRVSFYDNGDFKWQGLYATITGPAGESKEFYYSYGRYIADFDNLPYGTYRVEVYYLDRYGRPRSVPYLDGSSYATISIRANPPSFTAYKLNNNTIEVLVSDNLPWYNFYEYEIQPGSSEQSSDKDHRFGSLSNGDYTIRVYGYIDYSSPRETIYSNENQDHIVVTIDQTPTPTGDWSFVWSGRIELSNYSRAWSYSLSAAVGVYYELKFNNAGSVEIYSSGDHDVIGYITQYDDGYNAVSGEPYYVIAKDDDSGDGNNFKFVRDVEAGETLYLWFRMYYKSHSGTVHLNIDFHSAPGDYWVPVTVYVGDNSRQWRRASTYIGNSSRVWQEAEPHIYND